MVFLNFYYKIAALGFSASDTSKSGCLFLCYTQVLRAAWCFLDFLRSRFHLALFFSCVDSSLLNTSSSGSGLFLESPIFSIFPETIFPCWAQASF